MADLYHDVDIIERTEITPEGRIAKVYRASAYTKSGVRFTTDIQEKDLSKEKVNEVLTKQAALLEEIKAL